MYNSIESIKKWARDAISQARISEQEKGALLAIGLSAADKGLWRGDISQLWMMKGYTMADIPDMYP